MAEDHDDADVGALYRGLKAKNDQRRANRVRKSAHADEAQRLVWLKERLFTLSQESFDLVESEDNPTKRGALMQQGLNSMTGYIKMLDVCDKRSAKQGGEQ